MLHVQGTDSMSFKKCIKNYLSIIAYNLVDYYGHGKSSHNRNRYNLECIGNNIISFINNVIKEEVIVLGHSSGGLIVAYRESKIKYKYLILEDAPLFSSLGDERFNTFNYVDLSSICHNFINQNKENDFVYYYFMNQYAWKFFLDKSRDKLKKKLGLKVIKYRMKHPDKNLKVPFWPKQALEVFNGMNNYDPYFGETFYDDSFNNNIDYYRLLSKIKWKTIFMKANTTIGENNIIQCALTDEQLERVKDLIKDIEVVRFNCGHGIHVENRKEFIKLLKNIDK